MCYKHVCCKSKLMKWCQAKCSLWTTTRCWISHLSQHSVQVDCQKYFTFISCRRGRVKEALASRVRHLQFSFPILFQVWTPSLSNWSTRIPDKCTLHWADRTCSTWSWQWKKRQCSDHQPAFFLSAQIPIGKIHSKSKMAFNSPCLIFTLRMRHGFLLTRQKLEFYHVLAIIHHKVISAGLNQMHCVLICSHTSP